jgi:hypothetical protein
MRPPQGKAERTFPRRHPAFLNLRLARFGLPQDDGSVMSGQPSTAQPGRVDSLHLHPGGPGGPLEQVEAIEVVAGKGVRNDPRYFERISRTTGQPTRRQVSLMEREQIDAHAAALGLQSIPPGAVRANIETTGVDLLAWVGKEVRIGSSVLFFYEPRLPCEKMDAVCAGLRQLMSHNRQGVLAEVVRSGAITVGDSLTVAQSD